MFKHFMDAIKYQKIPSEGKKKEGVAMLCQSCYMVANDCEVTSLKQLDSRTHAKDNSCYPTNDQIFIKARS